MSFDAAALLQRLAELEALAAVPKRLIVAYSGGLDSTILAHLLAVTREQHGKALVLIHIDHGLQEASRSWAEFCQASAAAMGIDFVCERVAVERDSGVGPEAAAREARYQALAKHVSTTDWLLSAHHRDDQAETLLLNLLRGSGPAGLRAMPVMRKIGDGYLLRPLLGVRKEELRVCAQDAGLDWIEDPSNSDHGFDRNFLRANVMPALEQRWPHAAEKLTRSAELSGESADLLAELADIDIAAVRNGADRLSVSGLRRLSLARQKNLLRRAAVLAALPPPASRHLASMCTELLPAKSDAEPRVCWGGAEARRYRDTLYLLPRWRAPDYTDGSSLGGSGVAIGHGCGQLLLSPGKGPGLSQAVLEAGLSVRRRRGGEEIKLPGQSHTRKLKKLLQEERVVPWWRDELPLVYAGAALVAVADLWVAEHAFDVAGRAVEWRARPDLF